MYRHPAPADSVQGTLPNATRWAVNGSLGRPGWTSRWNFPGDFVVLEGYGQGPVENTGWAGAHRIL